MNDEQRGETVDCSPESLAGSLDRNRAEQAIGHTLRYRLPEVVERFIPHGMTAQHPLGIRDGLNVHQECDPVVVGVLESEFDVGPQSPAEALDGLVGGRFERVQLPVELSEGLFADAVEE